MSSASVETRAKPREPRWRHRLRTAESMVLLSVGAALQRWVPMTVWSPVLGRTSPVPDHWRGAAVRYLPARSSSDRERAAAKAVRAAARRLPWHSSCLAEAFAGQILLRQSRIPGVVVIGLRTKDEGPWDAHAWLLGECGALTGGTAARGFTPVTVFETSHGLHATDVDLEVNTQESTPAAEATEATEATEAIPSAEPGPSPTIATTGTTATWQAPQRPELTRLVSPPQID